MQELQDKEYEEYKIFNSANIVEMQEKYQLSMTDIDILYYLLVRYCDRKCVKKYVGLSYSQICNRIRSICKKLNVSSCRELGTKLHNYLQAGKN
jgi:hypothetical protein